MDSPSYTFLMGLRLGVVRAGDQSALAIAKHSLAALDRPLRCPAELWVAVARDDRVLIGAFQRGIEVPGPFRLARRGSGGPAVRIGAGTVHVALSLSHPAALGPCDEKRIVNRLVRPLLRALNKSVGPLQANFFGRDWVSIAHRPSGWVGFAHDATTQRTLFEAFVAVQTPFALGERLSFLNRAHGTLESIAGRSCDAERIAADVVEAYSTGVETVTRHAPEAVDAVESTLDEDLRRDPPWEATATEAIGTIGAGVDSAGVFRVGGELLASRDALARLESAARDRAENLGMLVDEMLAAPGVALEGIRSLATVRDVIARALGRR